MPHYHNHMYPQQLSENPHACIALPNSARKAKIEEAGGQNAFLAATTGGYAPRDHTSRSTSDVLFSGIYDAAGWGVLDPSARATTGCDGEPGGSPEAGFPVNATWPRSYLQAVASPRAVVARGYYAVVAHVKITLDEVT